MDTPRGALHFKWHGLDGKRTWHDPPGRRVIEVERHAPSSLARCELSTRPVHMRRLGWLWFAASVFACSEERDFGGKSDGGPSETTTVSETPSRDAASTSHGEESSSREPSSSENADAAITSSALSVGLESTTSEPIPAEAGTHPADAGRDADVALDGSSPDAAARCSEDEECPTPGPCWTSRCSSKGQCVNLPKDEGAICGAGQEVCSDVDRCDGAGACLTNHLAIDTPVVDLTPGDCLAMRCDGEGAPVTYALDSDVPSDPDLADCTVPSCTEGVPSTAYAEPRTACDDGLFCTTSDACDGSGTCVGGADPCASGVNDSNCANACDEDANTCTAYDPVESVCGNGLRCNAVGQCVQCLGDNECPGYGGGARNGICEAGFCIECRTDSDCGVTCEIPHCSGGFCDNDPACGGTF